MSQTTVHPCSGPSCIDGNCTGCRNGNLWCNDPLCSPNCPGCPSNNDTWSTVVIIIVIIIGLVLIGIVIWLLWHTNKPATLEKLTPIYNPDSNNLSGSMLRNSTSLNDKNTNVEQSNLVDRPINQLTDNKYGVQSISPQNPVIMKSSDNISVKQPLQSYNIKNNMIGGNLRL